MDDIEDLIGSGGADIGAGESQRLPQISNSLNLTRRNKTSTCKGENVLEEEKVAAQEGVPGTQKVWVKTFGCSHNISDSEYMAGLLDSYGYFITDEKENADVWVVNSCTGNI